MSTSRYCEIYRTTDGKLYMDLASKEYAGKEDATTYGPFDTLKAAEDYLGRFSNPGSIYLDLQGGRAVPKRSPNGMSVERPATERYRQY